MKFCKSLLIKKYNAFQIKTTLLKKCDCNDNIDRGVENSCDPKTGHCLKCLYNTDGIECEHCKEGYYGDAKLRNCRQ